MQTIVEVWTLILQKLLHFPSYNSCRLLGLRQKCVGQGQQKCGQFVFNENDMAGEETP